MNLVRTVADLLFPPVCFVCEESVRGALLCPRCWEESRLIEPKGRCIHCFELSEHSLCEMCQKDPLLPYPRAAVFEREAPILTLVDEEADDAVAGFAYYQWQQLHLPEPDFIIPIHAPGLARALAKLHQKPSVDLFRVRRPFRGAERWELKEGLIPEEAILQLLDTEGDMESLKFASAAISEAFPKRVHILSLCI